MCIARALGRLEIPNHRCACVYALEGVVNLTVGIHLKIVASDVFFQVIGVSVVFGNELKLLGREGSSAVGCVEKPDVFFVVNDLVWETAPLNQIHQVSRHVHYAFALLFYVKKPRWTN